MNTGRSGVTTSMIKGFKEYTKELSPYERCILLPMMVWGMKAKLGKENIVTNREAIKGMKQRGLKISPARFRKIMHVIRVSGMVPGIIATSNGYYIANTHGEFQDYIQSLTDRIKHIEALKSAIVVQYDNWARENQ